MRNRRDRVDYGNNQNPGGYPPFPQGHPGYPQVPAYPPGPPGPPETHRNRFLEAIGFGGPRIWLLIPFLILLLLFLIIIFVGRPYVVRGSSMEPTLREGDRVFVVKYRFGTTPDRGDVVVLKNVKGADEMLIKRVVAIAGDQVNASDNTLVVNGKYGHRNTNSFVSSSYSFIVPEGSVFVMGDNEAHSYDSRSFGAVPVQDVVGRAYAIFWPPGDLKKL